MTDNLKDSMDVKALKEEYLSLLSQIDETEKYIMLLQEKVGEISKKLEKHFTNQRAGLKEILREKGVPVYYNDNQGTINFNQNYIDISGKLRFTSDYNSVYYGWVITTQKQDDNELSNQSYKILLDIMQEEMAEKKEWPIYCEGVEINKTYYSFLKETFSTEKEAIDDFISLIIRINETLVQYRQSSK